MTEINPSDPLAGTVFEGWDIAGDQTVTGWGTQYDIAENKVQHGIEQTAGGASFASVIAPAWHNLGVVFDRPVPAGELLVAGGADFEAFKLPDYAVELNEDGTVKQMAEDPEKRKVCRRHPDTGELVILGSVSKKYQIFQYRDAFLGFGDALVDIAEPNAATCGVLFDGSQAFMCWKLPKEIMVGGEDRTDLWLLVHTSHDGSRPLTAAVTPLRTVCNNTCRWNVANAVTRWRVKHTSKAKLAIQEARTALKLSYRYTDIWEQLANQLADTSMTTAQFEEIVTHEFGPGEEPTKDAERAWDDKLGVLVDLFAVAETQRTIRNTAWAGLQAVGEYCDWQLRTTGGAFGKDNITGYRFWRSLDSDKSVQDPKQAMLKATMRFAHVKEDALAEKYKILAGA